MQAIRTKYLGPTDFRGSRVSAQAEAGRLIVPWDDALGTEENHRRAANAFCARFKWHGTIATGWNEGEAYHVFVKDFTSWEAGQS